jgi:hypothetical protein
MTARGVSGACLRGGSGAKSAPAKPTSIATPPPPTASFHASASAAGSPSGPRSSAIRPCSMSTAAPIDTKATRYPSTKALAAGPSSPPLALSVRWASTAASSDAERAAMQSPTMAAGRTGESAAVGPTQASTPNAPTSSAQKSAIQLRRNPSHAKPGAAMWSRSGAHRSLSPYGSVSSESSPMSLGLKPRSDSHAERVSFTSTLGRPLAKPRTPMAAIRRAREPPLKSRRPSRSCATQAWDP